MNPPLTAQVSSPSPVPARPTQYVVMYPTDNPKQWRLHSPTRDIDAASHTLANARPGSVMFTLPGSSPTPETRPAGEEGPFVIQEQAGIDRVYWGAIDPASGIVIGGERDRERAAHFRDALNAAYKLGLTSRPQQPAQAPEPKQGVARGGEDEPFDFAANPGADADYRRADKQILMLLYRIGEQCGKEHYFNALHHIGNLIGLLASFLRAALASAPPPPEENKAKARRALRTASPPIDDLEK